MKNRTAALASVSILLLSTYGFAAEPTAANDSSNIELTDDGQCAVSPADCEHSPKTKVASKTKITEVQQNQLRRIGSGVMTNRLTLEEVEKLRKTRASVQAAIEEARKDGKMSKEERDEIRKLQIGASNEIFQLKSNQIDLDKRLARMKSNLQTGIKEGRISQSEADLIQTRIANFESNLTKAKADGLTPDEHAALVKESNQAIQAAGYYGKKSKKQFKSINNEMMRVLGMDLGMKIGKCAVDGKLTQEEHDRLMNKLHAIYALEEKYQTESVLESKKLDKLDKSDKKDLQGELKSLQFEVKEACGADDKEEQSSEEKNKAEEKDKKAKPAN